DASYLTNKCWSNHEGASRIPARLLSPRFQPTTVRVTVDGVNSDPRVLSAIAVLADDLRRRMYEFIRRADGPVTRDEAAAAVGISRKLAAFHLDKLVDAGLLEAGFARPAGLRRAGRASKVYAPADADVQVGSPPPGHA